MTVRGPVAIPSGQAAVCALVFAADPVGCGGIILQGMPGPARDAWLAEVRRLLPGGPPWRKVPASVSEDRLLGGLDFSATVSSRRPVFASGLLEAADGGVLVLSMAERLPIALAAMIGGALERGEVRVERDGVTRQFPSGFGVIALDESLDGEAPIAAALAERLGLFVALPADDPASPGWTAADVADARGRVPGVAAADEVIAWLCRCAEAFGITSARAPLLALRVSRVLAALAGRESVTEDDAALAARLIFPQRARSLPAPEPEDGDRREKERQDAPPPGEQDSPPEETVSGTAMPEDLMVEAVRAAVPPGLLEQLQAQRSRQRRQSLGGRMGARKFSPRRGRPVGVRHTEDLGGQRLNILATLKAAAPWQSIRRRSRAGAGADALVLRKEDLHVSRFEERVENTTVFVVDASGSQAAQRLAEVKGAIELLLKDCYVRRDQVALIAFRGTSARLVLPPTRALARAKRSLAGLPGGGGTPLAAALETARDVADTIARSGRVPSIVLMTDGRANVARDEAPGAERAEKEALAAARMLGGEGFRSVLVDTARRPRPRAQALAEAMGAAYIPLPRADAAAISSTVQRSVAQ